MSSAEFGNQSRRMFKAENGNRRSRLRWVLREQGPQLRRVLREKGPIIEPSFYLNGSEFIYLNMKKCEFIINKCFVLF